MSNNNIVNTEKLSEAFKALSNPNRLEIFLRLLNCCELGTTCSTEAMTGYCVGELGKNLSVAPSTLSHHIKELQRAGLIDTQRKGQNVECSINSKKVDTLKALFSGDA